MQFGFLKNFVCVNSECFPTVKTTKLIACYLLAINCFYCAKSLQTE